MKVLYGEGHAHHTGPEPCGVDREVGGEASAGGGAGQPSSRERRLSRAPTTSLCRKAKRTVANHQRVDGPARRGLRPWHAPKLLAREPGDLLPIRGGCAAGSRREGEEP